MTIRFEEIMPEGLPVWDQGTMVRSLTPQETRAFCSAFRAIRQAHGQLLVDYHLQMEKYGQDRLRILSLLSTVVENGPKKLRLKKWRVARKLAVDFLKQERFEPDQA